MNPRYTRGQIVGIIALYLALLGAIDAVRQYRISIPTRAGHRHLVIWDRYNGRFAVDVPLSSAAHPPAVTAAGSR